MQEFALFSEALRRALSKRGFSRPTEVQEAAIPNILKAKNCLLVAPTGMGKTEAAVLPVFESFLQSRTKGISIVYITPLRALNRDLLERLEWWGKELGIKIGVRHGDTTSYQRRKQALDPPEMLITTPETLQAILPGKRMKEHLKGVRWVIVDEIHELAEDKRGAQLSVALERLKTLSRQEFQRIALSATIGSPEVIAGFLSSPEGVKIIKIPSMENVEIMVERPRPKKEDREIARTTSSTLEVASRLRRILELVEQHSSTLIFVNTRQMAEVLASRFRILGSKVGIHHSSLSQEVRVSGERQFKEEKVSALICTSSLELGIDIGSIDFVIQYGSPRQVTRLLQRVGRSGHQVGERSRGIILATDADDILESIAIVERAYAGELEEVEPNVKPYDVLAHQIVGIVLDLGKATKKEVFEILKGSSAFSGLEMIEFEEVVELLGKLRLVWIRQDDLGKTRRSREYYYQNLSTIPDERRYFVKDMVTQKGIGVLDEAFVVSNIDQGNLIIFRGAPWRIVTIDEDEITVEPAEVVEGDIPRWVGEEIPVPHEVARQVGRLRSDAKVGKHVDSYTLRLGLSRVMRHERIGIPVPDEKRILVELWGKSIIIHSCYGTKTNQTLGRVFSALLSTRLGHAVALQSDAYRIILQLPERIPAAEVLELFEVKVDALEPILAKSLKRTSLFRWKFAHVAKRFGALSKEASYSQVNMERMLLAYEGSPIFRETLKEIFKNNLSIAGARKVMEGLKKGELKLELIERKEPSPIAELGLASYAEVVVPERAERMIIKAMKKRVAMRRVELFCLYCAEWSDRSMIKNVPEEAACKKCGARMLAVLKSRDTKEKKRIYRKYKRDENLEPEERQELKRMQLSAGLFLSYGKKAVIVLAARGVGPETAKRILLASESEEELYKTMLRAERRYARTKRFWD